MHCLDEEVERNCGRWSSRFRKPGRELRPQRACLGTGVTAPRQPPDPAVPGRYAALALPSGHAAATEYEKGFAPQPKMASLIR